VSSGGVDGGSGRRLAGNGPMGTSETSVDNQFTRQYNPEDSCEHHTRRRENLKSHTC